MSRGGQSSAGEKTSRPIEQWQKPLSALWQRIDEALPIMLSPEKTIFAVNFLLALGVFYNKTSKEVDSALKEAGIASFDLSQLRQFLGEATGSATRFADIGVSTKDRLSYNGLIELRRSLQASQESQVNARELIGRILPFSQQKLQELLFLLTYWIQGDKLRPEMFQPIKPNTPLKPKKAWGYD